MSQPLLIAEKIITGPFSPQRKEGNKTREGFPSPTPKELHSPSAELASLPNDNSEIMIVESEAAPLRKTSGNETLKGSSGPN